MEHITMENILFVFVTAMLPLLATYLYQLVAVKVKDSKYADAVNAVWTAVSYVMQVFVDSAKASGKFDEEAQKLAFQKAKEAALDLMSAGTQAWIKKTYGDLDKWLTAQIESAVQNSKE